jgi:dTDP-glucose 4,6-dehydratase|tara:strand:- start:10033 stop:10161 length:129 start_codon:yes stop_codon:yes gene_type:complete
MQTVLITGGAGFIGSNFIPYFFEKNEEINFVEKINLFHRNVL